MNGAEGLYAAALAGGIEVCFANPGTTEMPMVAGLDSQPGLRAVLGLQENVVTGAADGYGRMAGKPALTMVHLGPGFANGIANLHNARRARTGIINLIGEHATWHAQADAPLASDIESLARPVSALVRRCDSAADMPAAMVEAFACATSGSGGIATLILPHDLQLADCGGAVPTPTRGSRAAVEEAKIAAAATSLKGDRALLFLGNAALSEAGLKAAGRIAQATGCRIMSQTSNGRAERGLGVPAFEKLPYLPEMALEALTGVRVMVLAGALSPVGFFGWPGMPSSMVPEGTEVVPMADPEEDIVGALEALAEAVGAGPLAAAADPELPPRPTGALTPEAVCAAIACAQPEDTVLVDEAITTGWLYHGFSQAAPRFSHLQITGGAIGLGPALALGAAVGAPDRPVINLQADGSALYTSQALWTQAREGCKVVTVICSNRRYNILQVELQRAGLNRPGPNAQSLTELDRPGVDWVSLAKGYGVPASAAETGEELSEAIERGLAGDGPTLIEARLP